MPTKQLQQADILLRTNIAIGNELNFINNLLEYRFTILNKKPSRKDLTDYIK